MGTQLPPRRPGWGDQQRQRATHAHVQEMIPLFEPGAG
jgi:hypothetical protein